jgi:hypothetical protein
MEREKDHNQKTKFVQRKKPKRRGTQKRNDPLGALYFCTETYRQKCKAKEEFFKAWGTTCDFLTEDQKIQVARALQLCNQAKSFPKNLVGNFLISDEQILQLIKAKEAWDGATNAHNLFRENKKKAIHKTKNLTFNTK